ncbi:hypothetical protein [Xenorhabdus stockiae]|uniref:hypothetical protein n=1 Tax=Xenorhabdus stockiae TaxID=351614 RepID=UPI0040636D0C
MITAIAASLTAIKESIGLVKVIGEAQSAAEIQKATYELNQQLINIQMENLKLVDLISSQKQEIMSLNEKLSNIDLFETQAEKYCPKMLESGTFTYASSEDVEKGIEPHYLCAHCHQKRVISVLQPCGFHNRHYQSYCPNCNAKFLMKKTTGIDPKSITRLLP